MKKFTLVVTALTMAAVSLSAEDNVPSVDKTFPNWAGHTVTYDVCIMGNAAKETLNANENVTLNQLEHWINTGGDLGRGHWNGVANDEWIATEGCDGGIVSESQAMSLFAIYEYWYNWWAGGWADQAADKPVDLSHINADTHVHCAVKVPSETVPLVIDFKLLRKSDEEQQAAGGEDNQCIRFSLASANGMEKASFPVVGELKSGEWTGVDITIGELTKLLVASKADDAIDYSRFKTPWTGRVCHISVPSDPDSKPQENAVFALDGLYFYTPGDVVSGIEDVDTLESTAEIVISARSISVLGASGIEVYSVSGQLVASSTGTVVGVDHLETGIYMVKAAGKVKKMAIN